MTEQEENTEINAIIKTFVFSDPIEVTYKPGDHPLTFRGLFHRASISHVLIDAPTSGFLYKIPRHQIITVRHIDPYEMVEDRYRHESRKERNPKKQHISVKLDWSSEANDASK